METLVAQAERSRLSVEHAPTWAEIGARQPSLGAGIASARRGQWDTSRSGTLQGRLPSGLRGELNASRHAARAPAALIGRSGGDLLRHKRETHTIKNRLYTLLT